MRARAARCIGNTGYSLLWRNCEHFARWCAVGRFESPQVRDALAGSVALGLVAAGASALARQRGMLLLGRAFPVLGPLGVTLSPVRQDGVRYVMPCLAALASGTLTVRCSPRDERGRRGAAACEALRL